MPIIIFDPPSSGKFGWGFPFNISSDLGHEVVGDGHWEIHIMQPPLNEVPAFTYTFPWNGSSIQGLIGKEFNGNWRLQAPVPGWIHLDPGTFRVELFDQAGTALQSQNQPVVVDHTSGTSFVTTQVVGQVQGGFTTTDRTTLQSTKEAVAGVLSGTEVSGAQIAKTVFELITEPPSVLLCRREGLPVSGITTLTRPGLLGPVSAYGADLDFDILPARLGLTDGVIDVTQERLCQVLVIRISTCGDEYVSALYDVRERHRRLTWEDPLTVRRVEVSALPGVTVGWTWLGLLVS